MTRFLVTFFIVLAALAAAAGFEWYAYGSRPVPLERSPVRFKVERGAGVAGIARAAQQAGVGVPTWRLWLAARLRGDSRGVHRPVRPRAVRQCHHVRTSADDGARRRHVCHNPRAVPGIA